MQGVSHAGNLNFLRRRPGRISASLLIVLAFFGISILWTSESARCVRLETFHPVTELPESRRLLLQRFNLMDQLAQPRFSKKIHPRALVLKPLPAPGLATSSASLSYQFIPSHELLCLPPDIESIP